MSIAGMWKTVGNGSIVLELESQASYVAGIAAAVRQSR